MKITPLPDGRLAVVFTVAEDEVLDSLAKAAGVDSRHFATVVVRQLCREDAPDLVRAIAALGMPLT